MLKVTPNLLNDTLQVVQLAREVALAKGQKAQAERFSPVAKDLRTLVAQSQEPKGSTAPGGILGQTDFKTLLKVAQGQNGQASTTGQTAMEKSQMVLAMANGNMSEVDIARQLGVTRDEVRLMLSYTKGSSSSVEVQA